MKNLWQDIRYGLRGLRRNPGFTTVAVLSLALGIGANTAIFSLVNAVLLRPLSFPDPDRLVIVWEEASFAGFPQNTPAPANYVDWRAQNQVFDEMAALDWRDFSLTGDGEPQKISAYGVTAGFFPLLGVKPMLGRTFLPEEDKPGAGNVTVISYGLWQNRYGGDRDILGRDILLNGEKYMVVGVMPRGFQFLESYISLWVPAQHTQEELTNRGAHYLTVVARMKQDVNLEQAQTDIQTITQGIARDHPDEAARIGSVVVPLREQIAGEISRPLIVLLVAVGFVLLIACANIANLLLARAATRRKEIAIRTALGARRGRIVRQLLTESILLAVAGGSAGLLLASWSFEFLESLIPNGMNLSTELELNGRMLLFTMLLSLLTGVIFGLVPAIQASRIDLNEALKQGGGRSSVGAGSSRLRGAMVVAQMALALVLLIGAGLLIQTFFRLRNQYSELRTENVLTMRTSLTPTTYDTHQKRVAFYDQVLERVGSLPGVVFAGYTTTVPLQWKGGTSGFYIEGRQPDPSLSYDANHRQVSRDYLQAMGIPLRQGRYFDSGDNAQSQPVAIINETMARQYWPEENALGKQFKVGDPDSKRPYLTIVGIAADVRQMGVDVPVKAEMYLPYQQVGYQQWFAPRDLVIRTTGDPLSIVSAVRDQIRAVDPNQPISNIITADEILGEETAERRIGIILLAAFAGLALLLASIGIYGVLSYFVAEHTPEIGVRLALGATPRNILALVLKRGMSLVLLGVTVGIGVSIAMMRLIVSLLFEVKATDPMTFAGITLMLCFVAFVACYIPARRAMKVDPMVALRYE